MSLLHLAAQQPFHLARLINNWVLAPWQLKASAYEQINAQWEELLNRSYQTQDEMLAALRNFQSRFQTAWTSAGSPISAEWEALRFASLKTLERLNATMSTDPKASTLTPVDYPMSGTGLRRLIPLDYGYNTNRLPRLADRRRPQVSLFVVRAIDAYASVYHSWEQWHPQPRLPDFGAISNPLQSLIKGMLRSTAAPIFALILLVAEATSEAELPQVEMFVGPSTPSRPLVQAS
jgi:hypothetical protein